MTLIEQLENITATQDDDFFSPEYKLGVLNDAKDHVIQTGISFEKRLNRSLRFLDGLRVTQDLTPDAPSEYEGFYVYRVGFPSDLNDWLFLEGNPENLTELQSQYELKHGNAQPSKHEGYYSVYDDGFNVYASTDDKSAFTLHYVKNHTKIGEGDESLNELGAESQKIVLYYAAMLMASIDTTLPKDTYVSEYNKFMKDLI